MSVTTKGLELGSWGAVVELRETRRGLGDGIALALELLLSEGLLLLAALAQVA